MGYASTDSAEFRTIVESWIADRSEVLALIRYSGAAGSKDFEFFHTVEEFRNRLARLLPSTCITVFRDPQLPLRGRIDDEFIARAIEAIPDGVEYLVAGLEQIVCEPAEWLMHRAGETHAELRKDLEEMRGELASFGPYPPWLHDNDTVISAVIPNPDGTVTTGAY